MRYGRQHKKELKTGTKRGENKHQKEVKNRSVSGAFFSLILSVFLSIKLSVFLSINLSRFSVLISDTFSARNWPLFRVENRLFFTALQTPKQMPESKAAQALTERLLRGVKNAWFMPFTRKTADFDFFEFLKSFLEFQKQLSPFLSLGKEKIS